METKKQKEFRKNDKLWHPSRGWGIVDSLHENREAAIDISFKGCLRCVMGEDISLLSFTEYPINANHVRPFEEGDIVYNEIHDIIAIYDSESRGALACKVFLMMQHPNEPVFRINETPGFGVGYTKDYISATPEQKQLLFDRLAQDNLRWNEETRKLEELDELKVDDDGIFFDFQEYSAAMVGKLEAIYNNRAYNYRATQGCYQNCIKWDGTKEQFDNVRKGIIK